jgi:ribA/ribD-fused uncharacterized protein
MNEDTINFFRGRYDFLSNFYVREIVYNGFTYKSTEHAYQAAKAIDPLIHDVIAAADTPGQSKKLVRKIQIREDWAEVKDKIMLDVLRLKFKHYDLRSKLLATGNATLIEGNTWGDVYWGVCEGKGLNMLGKMLMQVREEIKS